MLRRLLYSPNQITVNERRFTLGTMIRPLSAPDKHPGKTPGQTSPPLAPPVPWNQSRLRRTRRDAPDISKASVIWMSTGIAEPRAIPGRKALLASMTARRSPKTARSTEEC